MQTKLDELTREVFDLQETINWKDKKIGVGGPRVDAVKGHGGRPHAPSCCHVVHDGDQRGINVQPHTHSLDFCMWLTLAVAPSANHARARQLQSTCRGTVSAFCLGSAWHARLQLWIISKAQFRLVHGAVVKSSEDPPAL